MTSLIQSYGGVSTPSFLIVEKVQFSVLPPSQISQIEMPMKSGAYFVNKKYGVRTFAVSFSIKAPDSQSVMSYADQLATWLDYDEPQPLIFSNKPNITYYAIVDSTIDVTKFGQSGKGTITFICLDPHGYGVEKNYVFNPTDTTPVQVSNDGNQKVAPVINMEFTQNLTNFSIVSANDALIFGKPFDIENDTEVDLNPNVISVMGLTTNGWTEGQTVDNGTITAGLLTSNGYTIGAYTANGYGTGSGLHGGSLIHSLGKSVQDFTMEAYVGHQTSFYPEMGRIELYVLDTNGNKMGKIAIADTTPTEDKTRVEARAGSMQSGNMFLSSYGSMPYQFSHFQGVLRLTRKGNIWTAYIAKVDENGQHYWTLSKKWTDTQNLYNAQIGSVQLFIGAYGAYDPIKTMYFTSLNVTEHLSATSGQVDYVFRNGDKLAIDNSTGKILKNGEPYYEDLYPTSSFIVLDKGENGISVTNPTAITNGQITFKERWL